MKTFEVEKNQNLITFRSPDALHPLSVSWNFTVWMYSVNDFDFLNDLKMFLINEEAYIINRYKPFNDGGTSLGLTTVTSRYSTFNLFRLQNIYVQKLKDIVEHQFGSFIKHYRPEIIDDNEFDPVINCWYNVLKPGQEISTHAHSYGPNGFYSGHFTVACEDSETYYISPITRDKLDFKNSVGEGIFFPSYLEHGTSKHIGNNKRVTVAFDIYYKKDHCNENIRENTIKLNKEKLWS
jgi:hypothetical protein